MLKANLKKIKSVPRALIVILAVIIALGVIVERQRQSLHSSSSEPAESYTLHVKKQTYELEAAVTPEQLQQGLSGRKDLAEGTGMLFWFASENERCFWMKDMLFSLDMLWVNDQKKITYIKQNVSPASYPEQYCARARYVIELNAGEARKNGLTVGQRLNF